MSRFSLAKQKNIEQLAQEMSWGLEDLRIVPASSEIEAASYAVSLARHGEVDALMKGHVHTDDLMRAVLNRDNGLPQEPDSAMFFT